LVGIRRISENLSVGVLDLKTFTSVNPCDGKREAEKKGARFLLGSMLNDTSVEISYTSINKPILEGRKEHISISHSHDRLAIAVNTAEATGVDIELVRDKVQRITHKFMSDQELSYTGNDIGKLITWWAAKESLYKAGGERAVDFKTDIAVEPVAEHLLKGTIRLKKESRDYLLFHKLVDDQYILVFTLHEIQKTGKEA
jgi:4'-phosphopantetheinyl transferase